MNSDIDDAVAVRTIREWISGERTEFERIFFIAPGADPAGLEYVLGRNDAVLLPADCNWSSADARVMTYTGQMLETGDELFISDRGIELQDYLSAGFIEIVGPTAARFFDEAGWRAFLDDARLARRTGVFASSMIDPRVALADHNIFTAASSEALPQAIRLEADGTIGLGMQGIPLGSSDDWNAALSNPVSRAEALGAAVPPATVDADLATHPWLSRYLNAARLIKMLRLENGAAKIDGFGWSGFEDERANAEPLTTDPFLLEGSSGLVLADITSRRRQLLTRLSAEVVSALQSSSSLELARSRVAARNDVNETTAARLCSEAMELLSVNLGRQTNAPFIGSSVNVK